MTEAAALDRLSLNQRTTASWTLPEAIQGCVDAGLGAIGVWREQLAEVGLHDAGRLIMEARLRTDPDLAAQRLGHLLATAGVPR